MREIKVTDCNGVVHTEQVYNCCDFPLNEVLRKVPIVKKKFDQYYNVSSAFDIETTSVDGEKPYGFMYHWQFCIKDCVCFGRTWESFRRLIKRIDQHCQHIPTLKLVVYVHNLAFEFQFMHQFITITNVFAREKGKPLTVRTCEHIEFRCSMTLANMGLERFCQNSKGCIYWKKDGDDYDYRKYRTPFTPMTPTEEEYCYCDVRGLCECIDSLLEDDTIASIPLTSTGYVRRDFRHVMKANEDNNNLFKQLRLTSKTYEMCKEAFRGGNTSSNTLFVDEVLEDIESYDLQSSYPASMLLDKFPMSRFMRVTIDSREKFDRCLNNYACLFTIVVDKVKVKNLYTIPYLARAKCTKIANGKFGNGRVLSADRIIMTVTDIDWKIIESHYDLGEKVVTDMYIAKYDYLPLDFRRYLLSLFVEKCKLKHKLEQLENKGLGDSEEYKDTKYLYNKFKNRINAVYGMCVTDITNPDIVFENGEWDSCDLDVNSALNNYYNSYSSFLSYQHGVWVTANARKRLQDGLDMVGRDTIYIDTDSIKCLKGHKEELARANQAHYDMLANHDIDVVVDIEGTKYYIGDWEYEGTYSRFKTLGSKKYFFEKSNGYMELTLAGVNKTKGTKFFKKRGGCDGFNIGVIIPTTDSGRTIAYYNNEPIHKLKDRITGEEFESASNIAIINTTYELGITDEYQELLKVIKGEPL